MEFNYYYQYKVYENGDIENPKGEILKPQKRGFYELSILKKIKRVRCSHIVLIAFKKFPLFANQKVRHIDGNLNNNSLNNLEYYDK